MMGKNQESPKIESIGWNGGNKETTKGAKIVSLKLNEAKREAEIKETDTNTVNMLQNIMKAFNKDETEWKFNHLRVEYDIITNKIMTSYNTAIKDTIKNNKKVEDKNMESKENNNNFSKFFENRVEDSWDSTEQIKTLMENPKYTEYLSDIIMEPQPGEVLKQISDINNVFEKWSEEHKNILREKISEQEGAITHLWGQINWLDNQYNHYEKAA